MFGYGFFYSYWWIFPLMMIIFCIFFMRRGCGGMMCGFGLDKRFAQGEINEDEYEEKKRKLTHK
jgi:hypothetical protein